MVFCDFLSLWKFNLNFLLKLHLKNSHGQLLLNSESEVKDQSELLEIPVGCFKESIFSWGILTVGVKYSCERCGISDNELLLKIPKCDENARQIIFNTFSKWSINNKKFQFFFVCVDIVIENHPML